MKGSTYQVIEIVGSSDNSWEDAAETALESADESLRDLRVAEVKAFDLTVRNGKVESYRTRLDLSFKHHTLIKKIRKQERPEEVSD